MIFTAPLKIAGRGTSAPCLSDELTRVRERAGRRVPAPRHMIGSYTKNPMTPMPNEATPASEPAAVHHNIILSLRDSPALTIWTSSMATEPSARAVRVGVGADVSRRLSITGSKWRRCLSLHQRWR